MAETRSSAALTPAERKARSRAMMLGGLAGHLEEAERALGLVRHEIVRMTPELEAALDAVQVHLREARHLLPRARGV